jgi:hypothetical protein
MASAPDDERACDDEVRALTPDKHDDYNPFGQRADPKRQARPSPCRARRPPCDDYRAVAKRMKLSIEVPVEFTRNPSIETHRPTKKYPVGAALPAFRLPASIAFDDDEPYPRQPTTLLEALTL